MSAPRLRGLAAGAAAAAAGSPLLAAVGPRSWSRRNYRDGAVTLAAGPALVVGALVGALAAGGGRPGTAALGFAVVPAALAGGYDDLAGSAGSRGLRGHLGALRTGTLTTGVVKIVAIGTGALLAGAVLGPAGTPVQDRLLAGGLIAGTANLVNLLDLRPGRALKVSLLLGGPLLARSAGWPVTGAVGAAAVLLPADLGERAMLGDAGANALGAALGVGLAAGSGRRVRGALLLAVTALTLASERISFSAVIESQPALRWFDRLGRLP